MSVMVRWPTEMSPLAYWTLLALTCAYALTCGRRDERVAAVTCLGATVLTLAMLSPLSARYSNVESGVMLVDLGVLAAFVFIALKSERFWPLWIAGLQLTTTVAHVLKAVDAALLPEAYGAAMRFWSYPILIILALGTFRGRHRERRGSEAAA